MAARRDPRYAAKAAEINEAIKRKGEEMAERRREDQQLKAHHVKLKNERQQAHKSQAEKLKEESKIQKQALEVASQQQAEEAQRKRAEEARLKAELQRKRGLQLLRQRAANKALHWAECTEAEYLSLPRRGRGGGEAHGG